MKYMSGLLLLALTFCISACSSETPLDSALDNYANWKEISVKTHTQGSLTNVRSDGEYQALLKAFDEASWTPYTKLANWVEEHQREIPAPIYWHVAAKALQSGQPDTEVYKWLVIGQTTGRFDMGRCRDRQSSGAYVELVYTYTDLVKSTLKKPEQYLNGWGEGLKWLKVHPHKASPMWICSHGISAFVPNKAKPITYDDLILPDSAMEMSWTKYLEQSATVLDAYKTGKKPFPGSSR